MRIHKAIRACVVDSNPSAVTKEDPEPNPEKWSMVSNPASASKKVIYPGPGNELFHGQV